MTKDVIEFSVLGAAWLAATSGGVSHLADADEVLNRRLVGGLSQIPLRLADRLGDRVRLNSPVRSVKWSDNGVVVTTADGEVAARALILAVPPNLLSGISFDPPLPGWRITIDETSPRAWWSRCRRSTIARSGVTRNCPAPDFGPGLTVHEVYDNTLPEGGIRACSSGSPSRRRPTGASGSTPRAARQAAVLESFAAYFGPQAPRPVDFAESTWHADPWTRGAYSPTFGLGGLVRFGARGSAPAIGPLHFASSDIAGIGLMHVDGAIRSGRRAAGEVLDLLGTA